MPDTILSYVRNESFLYSRRENRVWGYISLAVVYCSYWLSCPNRNEVSHPSLCGSIENVLVVFDLPIMSIGCALRGSSGTRHLEKTIMIKCLRDSTRDDLSEVALPALDDVDNLSVNKKIVGADHVRSAKNEDELSLSLSCLISSLRIRVQMSVLERYWRWERMGIVL